MRTGIVPRYDITKAKIEPEMSGLWDGPAWHSVTQLGIDNFRIESSDHRPVTSCKLQYSKLGLFGLFKVEDRYVRCVHTGFQSDVYKDSCVEIFLEPFPGKGYFNFEFSCGGSLLVFHVKDPLRSNGGFRDSEPLDSQDDLQVLRFHSAPESIEPEQQSAKTWFLEFFIPFTIFEKYVGPLQSMASWKGNLYKCGDETSHPHWASRAPLDELNFHRPQNFGVFRFK